MSKYELMTVSVVCSTIVAIAICITVYNIHADKLKIEAQKYQQCVEEIKND